MADYVLGLDYGSDSCRAVIVDARTGEEAAIAVMNYPRWAKGLYSDPGANRFRQHPLDYIETLEHTVREAAAMAGPEITNKIRGISIDTTGSTPCAVDARGVPLALRHEFAENPSAMFVLWKDHSAIAETELINRAAKSGKNPDYTKFTGGLYSSEWFWAKVLRVLNEDPAVASAAVSFLEHCEWMPALLSGNSDVLTVKRSRCTMGHKGLWYRGTAEWNGYPPRVFFEGIDPRLGPIYETLGTETWPSDTVAGKLSAEWAARLGLPAGLPIGVGAIDAHFGGVGGGVRPGWMVMVVGTSTCDMIVGPKPDGAEKPIRGICGQVDGSIVPNMIGYEAGQSAFGDVYAWFRDLLLWPVEKLLPDLNVDGLSPQVKEELKKEIAKKLLPKIEAEAEKLNPAESTVIALDWLNGRRTPDVDARVKGAITGLGLGTDAVKLYRALVDATAFGVRAIVERFREEGIGMEGIYAVGGVARKSSLVMQTVADVLDMPINVLRNDQAVALGAAMFAAVVAGIYPDIPAAQKALGSPVEKVYTPNAERVKAYNILYTRYQKLGAFEQRNNT
ncbi:MAG: ribulokinase [Treponema sp.]|nr:ribulokinase [Treponema sp.]